MRSRVTTEVTDSHTNIAPIIVTAVPAYRRSPTMNPPPARQPVTIPTGPAPSETCDVFPHILHVVRPGRQLHQGTPARSP